MLQTPSWQKLETILQYSANGIFMVGLRLQWKRGLAREVAAAPLSYNLYHAEIYLNVPEDAERRDRQVQHATDLATAANWRPRP